METKKEIGLKLKELRIQKGKTAKEVSDDTGVPRSTISCYETGLRKPEFTTLRKLAYYYGVSLSYVLGENFDPEHEFVGDEIPEPLRELGFEYIPFMQKLKKHDFPMDMLDTLVDLGIKLKQAREKDNNQ